MKRWIFAEETGALWAISDLYRMDELLICTGNHLFMVNFIFFMFFKKIFLQDDVSRSNTGIELVNLEIIEIADILQSS